MPCQHICRVINENKAFTKDMFHVRWHKLYNYAVSRNVLKDTMCHTQAALKHMLKEIRTHHFHDNGKYKGIMVGSSSFLKKVEMGKDLFFSFNDRERFILDHYERSLTTPFLSGSYKEEDFQMIVNNVNDINIDEEPMSFSVCSQTEYNISQNVDAAREVLSLEDLPPRKSLFDIVSPSLEAALGICSSNEDAEKLSDHINSFVLKEVSKRKRSSISDEGTSFFGENFAEKNDKCERFKFGYERRVNKHKKK